MINKKSDKANLENKKGMFFLIGLVISLGFILSAFEWKSEPRAAPEFKKGSFTPTEFVYIPPTSNEKKKLPIQKIEVPLINLVSNDSDVNEDLDFLGTDPDDEVPIDFNNIIYTSSEENAKIEEIFYTVDQMPLFPGGEQALLKFLANNVNYPVIAQENGIEGKVFVSFVIDEEGLITDVTLLRGVDVSIDNEALRVVRSMPLWKPGKQGNRAVKVRYSVPIHFELQ